MPSFGRLGKSANRSSQSVSEQQQQLSQQQQQQSSSSSSSQLLSRASTAAAAASTQAAVPLPGSAAVSGANSGGNAGPSAAPAAAVAVTGASSAASAVAAASATALPAGQVSGAGGAGGAAAFGVADSLQGNTTTTTTTTTTTAAAAATIGTTTSGTSHHHSASSAPSTSQQQEPFVDAQRLQRQLQQLQQQGHQGQQQQQQQQQPSSSLHQQHSSVQLPAHILSSPTLSGVQLPTHVGSFEGLHQQFQQVQYQQQLQHQQDQQNPTTQDFAAVAAAQGQGQGQGQGLVIGQRYSTTAQQLSHSFKLEQAYAAISTTSLDELSGLNSYHPAQGAQGGPSPPPASSEKRSTRKLIKGIFAKAATGVQDLGHHGHSHAQSQGQIPAQANPVRYDNTGGLSRRPSKRVSTSNIYKASLPHLHVNVLKTEPARKSWAASLDPRSSKLLSDAVTESDSPLPPQNSRIIPSLNTTIRKVANDPEVPVSAYDDISYPPSLHAASQQQQQQQQPGHAQSSLASHDQQYRYDHDQPAYDQVHSPVQQPGQQFVFPVSSPPQDSYHQSADSSMISSYPGPGLSQQLHPQNPETISQLSHDSYAQDLDQRSTHQQLEQHTPPSIHYSTTAQGQDPSTTASQALPPAMISAPGAPPNRRTTELDRTPPQLPAGYRTDANVSAANSPPGAAAMQQPGQGPATPGVPQYRAGERAPQMDGTTTADPGRNSPQPSTTQERDSESEKAFKELLTKYKHVKRLYFDGRAQIDQLNGQVEHLQNAVANQRMSSSRTALDDNEYSNRFNRLNGAINNLSFNIRKDWRSVPSWLEKFVTPDALKTGKQEMTAVGRAVISRWLLEELFNKCFHPDLETTLSAQLKEVELGIRAGAPTMHSQEEVDAHTAKVVSWRMATLDGLRPKLLAGGTAAVDNRHLLITKATSNLTACLYQHLGTPPPHGVEGSASTIVELAVSIAANLPKESRDVCVTYPMPGDVLQPHLMEVEKAGLPALEGQKPSKPEGEADAEDKEGFSMEVIHRVRLAAFLALEVRGRQVLMKAPVWTM